jgi:uncharacterized protein YjbI with pentapeptide repeats
MLAHPLAAVLALLFLLLTSPAGAADTVLSARCIGCDLHGQDLQRHDLHGATYIGTDMQNIDLRDANLQNVKFIGVDLSGGTLDGADLRGSTFTGVDFGSATLRGSRVTGIRLTGVNLERVQLGDVDVPAFLARCIGCDFARADLHGLDMHGSGSSSKPCVDLRGARVAGADFRNVRWCAQLDRGCRPATAGELRRLTGNPLTGAQLP